LDPGKVPNEDLTTKVTHDVKNRRKKEASAILEHAAQGATPEPPPPGRRQDTTATRPMSSRTRAGLMRDDLATRGAIMFATTKAFSGFAVDDLDKAKEFYEGTLGLKVSQEDGLLTLHLAGDRPTLIYLKPDFAPATYTILNFQVADIHAAVDELSARGVHLERYEGFDQDEKGIARPSSGPAIAWFTDPAGNILSVLEEG
jgi:catechol 2,3-dioxygenase-like lactoylglutathione lyase family enzyme